MAVSDASSDELGSLDDSWDSELVSEETGSFSLDVGGVGVDAASGVGLGVGFGVAVVDVVGLDVSIGLGVAVGFGGAVGVGASVGLKVSALDSLEEVVVFVDETDIVSSSLDAAV